MSNHNKPSKRHPNHPQTNQPQQGGPQQVLHQKATFYQGAIPKPEDLEHYERISPGFADRIIKITETEISHRRGLEDRIVRLSYRSGVLGQVLAFGAVLAVCGLCYMFLINGAAQAGAWIAGGVLVSIAAVFLSRKK